MEINIDRLPSEFTGTGEVKGFKFTKVKDNPLKGYLFKVEKNGITHYEVVKSIVSPKCIDFKERIYSETDFRESYPKSNRFGIDAWTYYNFDKAFTKLMEL